MRGFQLKFYMHENRKHRGVLLYEWLLEKAKELEIHGGSVFRSIAGYGRHGVIHEEYFFELASNVPVVTVFILSEQEYDHFLKEIEKEKLNIFYVKVPVEYGVLNGHLN